VLIIRNQILEISKKAIPLVVCIALTLPLIGCATTYDRGEGIVISEKKVKDKDYKPHQNTQTGAIDGGTVGVIGGAVGGGLVGLGVGAVIGSFGGGIPLILATTFGGAAIGGLTFGVAGTVVGSGVGYAVDVSTPDTGVYEFTVQSENQIKPLTITQYSSPIPVNTPVRILEKNNLIFIKQK
jgi:hypothetical protein